MSKPEMVGPDCDLVNQFTEAGIVPEHCRRIILDMQVGGIVKLYYECYGDSKILELDIPGHLGAGVKIINTSKQ